MTTSFKVFDGKKRFLVKVQIIEDQNLVSEEGDQNYELQDYYVG